MSETPRARGTTQTEALIVGLEAKYAALVAEHAALKQKYEALQEIVWEWIRQGRVVVYEPLRQLLQGVK